MAIPLTMSLSTEDLAWVHHRLQGVPLPRFFSVDHLKHIAESIQKVIIPSGKIIIKQGQKGKNFYMIRSGSVGIWAESGPKWVKIGTLREGDYFGEVSILKNMDRNATVIAEGEVQLIAIPAPTLLEMSRTNLDIKKNLAATASRRAGAFDLKAVSAPLHKQLIERLKSLLKG